MGDSTTFFWCSDMQLVLSHWSTNQPPHCSELMALFDIAPILRLPAVPASRRHRLSIFQLFSQSRFTAKYFSIMSSEKKVAWRFPLCCFSLQPHENLSETGRLAPARPKQVDWKKGVGWRFVRWCKLSVEEDSSESSEVGEIIDMLAMPFTWHLFQDVSGNLMFPFPNFISWVSIKLPEWNSETSFWSTKQVP